LSTGHFKNGVRDLESRTKSPKIEKMFYSVTFAKTVRSQIAANLRNQRFARNQGQAQ